MSDYCQNRRGLPKNPNRKASRRRFLAIDLVAMAAFARLFQLPAALLRLAAVLAMFAFRLTQPFFGLADALFALVTPGLRRNCTGRKERNQECGGEQLASKLHVPLLGLSRGRPLGEPIGM